MMLLSAIVAAASAGTLIYCAESDKKPNRKPSKSDKSKKGGKSRKSARKSSRARGKSSKSKKSRKSSKSSKSKKSRKSSKSSKSKKSKKTSKSSKSEKSSRSKKGSKKSSKTAKKIGELDKTQKSSKKEKKTADQEALKKVPNDSSYRFSSSSSAPVQEATKASTMVAAPNKLPFDKHGGIETVKIANNTGARKAFKVKCTDNMLYSVNPVYGFAEDGETFNIEVLRNNGELKTDNLVVLAANVAKDEGDAKKVFAAGPEREMVVIPLIAAK